MSKKQHGESLLIKGHQESHPSQMTGWIIFSTISRPEYKTKNPNASFGELTQIISAVWKEMPAFEKEEYGKKARQTNQDNRDSQNSGTYSSDSTSQYQSIPQIQSANDYILDFGKHKGSTLNDIPFSYLLWLSNRAFEEEGINSQSYKIDDFFEYRVKMSIWDDRDSINMSCCCGVNVPPGKSHHSQACYGYVLASTLPQTVLNMKDFIRTDPKNSFKLAQVLKPLLWVQDYRASTIHLAQQYIDEKKLCWKCGVVMPSIGTSRHNGANHSDWDDRILHKRCWVEAKNNCNSSDDE